MSDLVLGRASSAACKACGHPNAFHRSRGGPCFAEPNRDRVAQTDIDIENFELRKELRVECWCRAYQTDVVVALKSIISDGDANALIRATDLALQSGDDSAAGCLLDRYIAKCGLHERDAAWIDTIKQRIVTLRSKASAGTASTLGREGAESGSNPATKLPAGFSSSLDSVGENPFSPDDLRHKVWEDATRRAEEKLHRFRAELLRTRLSEPIDALNHMRKHATGTFDIWAERYVNVVWSDKAVQDYDQWLHTYVEAWLHDINAKESFRLIVPIEVTLSELRLSLMERLEWWKAEARRYVASQKAHLAAAGEKCTNKQNFTHSEDYRCIVIDGTSYSLSSNQALIITELHAAYERGLAGCSGEYLLERLGSPSSRLRDSFRSGDGPKLWGHFIRKVHGKKDLYCLLLKSKMTKDTSLPGPSQ
jgi:hypothetical protein